MSFGSRRWFPYTTDAGNVYGLNLDESNVELFNPGADAITIVSGTEALPIGISPRKIKTLTTDGTRKDCVILDRATYDAIAVDDSYTITSAVGEESPVATIFKVIQRIPEKQVRVPRSIDTGKIDGDQP